jgi:microsomal epoxide hydrolase
MRSRARLVLAVLALLCAGRAAHGQVVSVHRSFTTSDGVRLHYLEAGPPSAPTIVLIPGWTMPAWIFQPQIIAFARRWHVIAFDPRGQGESDVPLGGYEPVRRGQDIAELLARLGNQRVVLLGWSLGVLDALAYVHANGDGRVAGMVLVDNSVGEDPAPVPHRVPAPPRRRPAVPHEVNMRRFVESMFRRPQPEPYLEALTEATLHTPLYASRALLSYPVPRTYWREAIYMVHAPILYVVRPVFEGQAESLARKDPYAESVVLTGVGHALFVDDASRFNALVQGFIARRIWH